MCRCGGKNRGRCCGSRRSPSRARSRGGRPEAGECGSVHGSRRDRSRGRRHEALEYGGRGSPSRRSRFSPCRCGLEESWERPLPPRPDCRWASDFSELRRRWSEHAKRQNNVCEKCKKVPFYPLKSEDTDESFTHADYQILECRCTPIRSYSRRRRCYKSRSPSSCRASTRSSCRRDESDATISPCDDCRRRASRRECGCSPRADTRTCSREYVHQPQCSSCAPSEHHLSRSPCRHSRNETLPVESTCAAESARKNVVSANSVTLQIQSDKIKPSPSDCGCKDSRKEFSCQVNIENHCSEVNKSRKEGCCQTMMKNTCCGDRGLLAKLSGHTGCVALASFALLIFVSTSWVLVTAAVKTRCCNPPPSFLNFCPNGRSYCSCKSIDLFGHRINRSPHNSGACRQAAERGDCGSPGDGGRRRRAPCQCARRRSLRENSYQEDEEGRRCSEGRYPKVHEEGELLITADSGAREGAPAEPPPRVDDNEERVHYDGEALERERNRGRSRRSRNESTNLDVGDLDKGLEESSGGRSNRAVSWSRFAEAACGGGAGKSRDSQPDEVDDFRGDGGRRYADCPVVGMADQFCGDLKSTKHRRESRNDNPKKSIYFTHYEDIMNMNGYRQDVSTQYSRSKLKKVKNHHDRKEPISAIDIVCPKYTTGCKDSRKKRKSDKRSSPSKYYITAASPRKTVSDDNQRALSKPRRSRKKNAGKHH